MGLRSLVRHFRSLVACEHQGVHIRRFLELVLGAPAFLLVVWAYNWRVQNYLNRGGQSHEENHLWVACHRDFVERLLVRTARDYAHN